MMTVSLSVNALVKRQMTRYLPVRHCLITAENVLLSVLLATMVFLPLAEIVLRKTLYFGIEGVTVIVQHITLAVGILGAAVAARENRLLSLSVTSLLKGRVEQFAKLFSFAISAAVVAFLCLASLQFIQVERMGGNILVYSLPVWVAQLVLPVGYGLITLRLLRYASAKSTGRGLATLLASGIVAVAICVPIDPQTLVAPGLIVLLAATLLGAPIFIALGGTALILLWGEGVPIASVAVDHYSLVGNPSLPTIPMFTLAGYLLAESSAPQRLINVFNALFAQFRGGAAIVTVLACTFFTCFTGASGVTILALGGLVMPLLLASGYENKHALGLVTGAGSAGVLLMPALPLILYAIVAQTNLEAMFLGGIFPVVLMTSLIAWWGIGQQTERRLAVASFNWDKAKAALWDAKWELILPLVPIVSLFSGLATPVEAAAVTAFYAFFVVTVVHRDLRLNTNMLRVMTECGLLVGGILLILGVALGFTNYLVDAQVPDQIVNRVTQSIESRWVFLLALNGFLLVVGCVMDIFSAIVVVSPLIVPIGLAFGVDPVHLGIIFLANMELGYLTPPVGMNLFFASYRFDKPIVEVYRSVLPLFFVLCLGVLLITYIPFLSTALPGALR
jgi:tripartite ATP-independent transporter DctM subunit